MVSKSQPETRPVTSMPGEVQGQLLLVDDDEAGRYAKSRLLRRSGYVVREAENGREALRFAAEHQPNLVILDINLPDINGIEVCRLLKASPGTANIPVLHVSATHVESEWYVAGLESGADGYLAEPVDPPVFLATVRALLRTQKAEAALRRARDELEMRVAERTAALAEANEALRRQVARAEALTYTASLFNADLDFEHVLETICEETARALHVPVVGLRFYNERAGIYKVAAGYRMPPELQKIDRPIAKQLFDPGASAIPSVRVLPDAQSVLNQIEQAEEYAASGVRTIVIADLEREGLTAASLVAYTLDEVRSFTADDLALLRGLADQAALALTNARLFAEVQTGREKLRQLAQRLVTAQEEERRRLAQELHDNASQNLTSLRIALTLLSGELPTEEQWPGATSLREQVDVMQEIIDETTSDMRHLSHGLRPFALEDANIDSVLQNLCDDFTARTRIPVTYRGQEMPPLADIVRLTFYRVLQEALANVAKHATASQVQVVLAHDDGQITLEVSDDGQGFDVSGDRSGARGMGIVGMQERLALLGGEVRLESEPGRGTRVLAQLRI